MKSTNLFELLPDSLIISIFNKLPHVGNVRRAAASCQRFKALANQVEELVLYTNLLSNAVDESSRDLGISLMLAQSAKGTIKLLEVTTESTNSVHGANVVSWIAAASPSLRILTIEDTGGMKNGPCLEAASHCPHLRTLDLVLSGGIVHPLEKKHLDACRGGLKELHTLILEGARMTGPLFSELVALCPKLRCLGLEGLKGIAQVDLESKTLEVLKMTVVPHWTMGPPEQGFSSISLSMPALRDLIVGDLEGLLVVRDAPLKGLILESFRYNAVVDLGSKAILASLTLSLDQWPLFHNHRKPMSVKLLRAILNQAKPHTFKKLEIPSSDPCEQITPAESFDCFQQMAELEILGLHASFIAACGFGGGSTDRTRSRYRDALLNTDFHNLLTLKVYLDNASPFCFDAIELIANNSRSFRDLTIRGDSGVEGYHPSEFMIAQILTFKLANPRIKVTLTLSEEQKEVREGK